MILKAEIMKVITKELEQRQPHNWLQLYEDLPQSSMTTPTTPSAKDRVLAWVRSKNPQTMELKFGCLLKPRAGSCTFMVLAQDKDFVQVFNTFAMKYELFHKGGNVIEWVWKTGGGKSKEIVTFDERFEIIGSDMGLQELLIALPDHTKITKYKYEFHISKGPNSILVIIYDLQQNLHNQSPEFYEAILPLIQND